MKLSSLPRNFLNGVTFGLGVSMTVLVVSLVYAGVTNIYYSDLPAVSSGSGLTATSWNNLVNYANKAVKQNSEVITVTGSSVGIGITTPTAGIKLDINGSTRIQGGLYLDNIPAYSTGTQLMLAMVACSQKPANGGWVGAVKMKGSGYSSCTQVCANNGPYYINCQGEVSVRDFGKGGVNVSGWACSDTTYATSDEMFCCCSY